MTAAHPGPTYAVAALTCCVSTLLSLYTDAWPVAAVLLLVGLALFAVGVRIHLRGQR